MSTAKTVPVIDRDRLALAPREELSVELREVAGRPAVVVDGVFRDPEYVRALGLSLDFDRAAGAYPGGLAFVSVSAQPLLDLANALLADALGGPLAFTPSYGRSSVFALTTTSAAELSPGQKEPHRDGFCDYAAIVYLNPPEQCSGGTSFWRHRKTGLEIAEDEQAWKVALAMAGPSPSDPPEGYLLESTAKWERTEVLEMRWNRFVAYSSYAFHSPLYDPREFGETDDTRRLTQNVYLNKATRAA